MTAKPEPTLLEKALAFSPQRKYRQTITEQHIELMIAFAHGTVSIKQFAMALGKIPANATQNAWSILRSALQDGLVILERLEKERSDAGK
jgi:hypothetical protein